MKHLAVAALTVAAFALAGCSATLDQVPLPDAGIVYNGELLVTDDGPSDGFSCDTDVGYAIAVNGHGHVAIQLVDGAGAIAHTFVFDQADGHSKDQGTTSGGPGDWTLRAEARHYTGNVTGDGFGFNGQIVASAFCS